MLWLLGARPSGSQPQLERIASATWALDWQPHTIGSANATSVGSPNERRQMTVSSELWKWSCLLMLSLFAWASSAHFYGFQMMRSGLRIRVACSHLIYAKALKLAAPSAAADSHSHADRGGDDRGRSSQGKLVSRVANSSAFSKCGGSAPTERDARL